MFISVLVTASGYSDFTIHKDEERKTKVYQKT